MACREMPLRTVMCFVGLRMAISVRDGLSRGEGVELRLAEGRVEGRAEGLEEGRRTVSFSPKKCLYFELSIFTLPAARIITGESETENASDFAM